LVEGTLSTPVPRTPPVIAGGAAAASAIAVAVTASAPVVIATIRSLMASSVVVEVVT
jgi:hypothetical protein